MRTQEEKIDFINVFKLRLKNWVIRVLNLCETFPENSITSVINYQLIKSSTSTGANYRTACRARSPKEFFAKMSIAVEEADESLFWLEVIDEKGIPCEKLELIKLKNEIDEILKVLLTARANTKC